MGIGNGLDGSSVICAFLDTTHDDPKLVPEAPKEHWRGLHWEALADGLCEAWIAAQRGLARPIEIRSESWIKRQKANICRTTTCSSTGWETSRMTGERAQIDFHTGFYVFLCVIL